MQTVTEFQPDYVIHLAARTDLRGKELAAKLPVSKQEGTKRTIEWIERSK